LTSLLLSAESELYDAGPEGYEAWSARAAAILDSDGLRTRDVLRGSIYEGVSYVLGKATGRRRSIVTPPPPPPKKGGGTAEGFDDAIDVTASSVGCGLVIGPGSGAAVFGAAALSDPKAAGRTEPEKAGDAKPKRRKRRRRREEGPGRPRKARPPPPAPPEGDDEWRKARPPPPTPPGGDDEWRGRMAARVDRALGLVPDPGAAARPRRRQRSGRPGTAREWFGDGSVLSLFWREPSRPASAPRGGGSKSGLHPLLGIVTDDPLFYRLRTGSASANVVSSCLLLALRVSLKLSAAVVTWCSLNGSVPRGVVATALAGVAIGAPRGKRRMAMLAGVLACRGVSEFWHGTGNLEFDEFETVAEPSVEDENE